MYDKEHDGEEEYDANLGDREYGINLDKEPEEKEEYDTYLDDEEGEHNL